MSEFSDFGGVFQHSLPSNSKYGVSQFQNPEVFPSHKTMFSPYDMYAYDLENFFIFLALWSPDILPEQSLTTTVSEVSRKLGWNIGRADLENFLLETNKPLQNWVAYAMPMRATINEFSYKKDNSIRQFIYI